MKHSQRSWDPSQQVIKSKSCFERIFSTQKTEIKFPLKPLKPVAQKLKLSKNYSNQKQTSSRSLKNLKLKSSRKKNQINLEEIKKKFKENKNLKINQNKRAQISVNPYLNANTLQTSLVSFKIYEQRQDLENIFNSHRCSLINSKIESFKNSEVSLRIIGQKYQTNSYLQRKKISNFNSPQYDSKYLSSTRINTINSSAFISKNSFYKDEILINEEQNENDDQRQIFLQNSRIQKEQNQNQQKMQFSKEFQKQQATPQNNKTFLYHSRIKLLSARQVQTIQSIKTQQSLVINDVQHQKSIQSNKNSNIFHRILALKKH